MSKDEIQNQVKKTQMFQWMERNRAEKLTIDIHVKQLILDFLPSDSPGNLIFVNPVSSLYTTFIFVRVSSL